MYVEDHKKVVKKNPISQPETAITKSSRKIPYHNQKLRSLRVLEKYRTRSKKLTFFLKTLFFPNEKTRAYASEKTQNHRKIAFNGTGHFDLRIQPPGPPRGGRGNSLVLNFG